MLIKPFFEQSPEPHIEALALGFFDGVHRGHRYLFRKLLEISTPERSGVATFEPHPLRVIAPEHEPPLLMTLPQKIQAIQNCGVPNVFIWGFDEDIRNLSPDLFAKHLRFLFPSLRQLVVGENWRFGFQASGTPAHLSAFGQNYGWKVHVIPPICDENGLRISSSLIRKLIKEGRILEAEKLLGDSWRVTGRVVKGAGIGRQIGFPTANLELDRSILWPPDGVYAGVAECKAKRHLVVINVGYRPTVSKNKQHTLEVHLINYEGGDLYGEILELSGWIRLRAEQQFASLEALQAQIKEDIARACSLKERDKWNV
ncbi:MAG: bifunctional riboflavin kinase/FAD synthetase [Verrucomicrobiae bacterium]|nr:bifunctional riboflavin kinase/FAD synthetase [Verrucomicrobiae bacterium]